MAPERPDPRSSAPAAHQRARPRSRPAGAGTHARSRLIPQSQRTQHAHPPAPKLLSNHYVRRDSMRTPARVADRRAAAPRRVWPRDEGRMGKGGIGGAWWSRGFEILMRAG
ncbi:hypothetical protein EJ06DRAFT_367875 [Trichodelitschia bisporula]|uniref:Uncharacterized protein n=1 Tax=Trichodelitschia bisporula TaxID=703511 RepID=A0A6G1I169_9PEZI|nr:hypothetical protein EJ06DRAFT_367875 [Trichodelitschia bisporula]